MVIEFQQGLPSWMLIRRSAVSFNALFTLEDGLISSNRFCALYNDSVSLSALKCRLEASDPFDCVSIRLNH